MTDAEITINDQTESGTTVNVDTKSMVGVGAKTVHRQAIVIGDPTTFGQVATVNTNGELKVKHTDAIPITDNAGSLTVDGSVSISGSVAVTNANLDIGLSTLATQATLALIKAKTDNLDVALSTLETTTADVSDNPLRDNGKIDIAAFDVALPAGTNNIGDIDVLSLPALPAGTNNIGDVDILTIAAGDNNIGNVDIVSLPALVAGTANIGDVDVLTLPNVAQATASNLKNEPNGHVAHDGIDSGNPLKMGGRARTSNITSVAQDDRVDAIFDKNGRQIIVAGCQRELRDSAVNASAITNTTETTIIAAVASEFHDIESIIISNSSAVATLVQIRDVAAGTVIMNIYSPAGSTVGASIPNGLPQTTVNTAWTAQAVTTASSLFVTMTYVKNV